MLLIKRYSNRKLYSSISKKYITTSSLITLIATVNEKVKVVDYETGEDLTKQVVHTWMSSAEGLECRPEFLCWSIEKVAA